MGVAETGGVAGMAGGGAVGPERGVTGMEGLAWGVTGMEGVARGVAGGKAGAGRDQGWGEAPAVGWGTAAEAVGGQGWGAMARGEAATEGGEAATSCRQSTREG